MMGAGLDGSLLRLAIHRHQPNLGAVAENLFEVVEQRPVDVAANVHALGQTILYPTKRPVNVFDAAGVVLGADAVFRNVDWHADPGGRVAQALLEGLRPEFIAHLRQLDAWLRPQVTTLSDAG